jgi:hypothetical protein
MFTAVQTKLAGHFWVVEDRLLRVVDLQIGG